MKRLYREIEDESEPFGIKGWWECGECGEEFCHHMGNKEVDPEHMKPLDAVFLKLGLINERSSKKTNHGSIKTKSAKGTTKQFREL